MMAWFAWFACLVGLEAWIGDRGRCSVVDVDVVGCCPAAAHIIEPIHHLSHHHRSHHHVEITLKHVTHIFDRSIDHPEQ